MKAHPWVFYGNLRPFHFVIVRPNPVHVVRIEQNVVHDPVPLHSLGPIS